MNVNNFIWMYYPKTRFHRHTMVRIGIAITVCIYNNGESRLKANQSFNHSIIQSFQSFKHSIIQSFNHSIKQLFNHSINQSFNHSIKQSFNHSIIQSFKNSKIQSFRILGWVFCQKSPPAIGFAIITFLFLKIFTWGFLYSFLQCQSWSLNYR